MGMATATIDVRAPDFVATSASDTAPLSPARQRLEDQIQWYDTKSQLHQRWFKLLKICQIVTAAAIPVAAGASVPKWLLGAACAFIVGVGGRQQPQQHPQDWFPVRSTCERLRHAR